MTKVEELRVQVADVMMYEHDFDAGKLLDSLIAAAREEAIHETQWNMIHLNVQEMLDHLYVGYLPEKAFEKSWRIIEGIVATATAQGIEKGRAEGAEQMKETIRKEGEQYSRSSPVADMPGKHLVNTEPISLRDKRREEAGEETKARAACDIYIVPASLLSPAPKEEK